MMSKTRKLLRWSGITILAMAMIGACGGTVAQPEPVQEKAGEQHMTELEPIPLGAGEKLRVIATTNIVGDVVGQVGGDYIELTTLMKIGVDPHTYVPAPSDTAAIHDAHVVFANGAGLEADLQDMFESAGGEAEHVHLSEGLALREAEGRQEGEHEGADPHVWFSVPNVIHWVENIEHTLSTLDPANSQVYRTNAGAYIQELEDLDAWARERMATIPAANRKLVTNHPAFGYLADRYGLEQVGAVYPISPSSQPSAHDIAALEDTIHEYDVPAVFTESTVNAKLAEQIADDTSLELVPLYSGSLGELGSGAESYILLIRFDVSAIVDALQ